MALDIISTINLDLKRPNTETVYAVQYDTAGRIKAQLTNDGEAWHVPTSAGGMVSFRKSDNIGGFYDTTELGEVAVSVDENDDSVIYIALDAQTTITATPLDHPVQMQINFYNSQGKRLSTFAFYLRVQASVLYDGDQDERPVASEWTFRILTGALGQTIKNQEEAIKWMEDNIRTQEGYVVDDTLKVEGAAGDAKKIGELFEEIVKISDSMPGYFPTTDTERVGNTKYYTRSGTAPNYVYTEFTGATFATGVTYYEYSPWNRIWIDPDDNDVAIPTMDDHNELSRHLSDVESAIEDIDKLLIADYSGSYTTDTAPQILCVFPCAISSGNTVKIKTSYTGSNTALIDIRFYDGNGTIHVIKVNHPIGEDYEFVAVENYTRASFYQTLSPAEPGKLFSAEITIDGEVIQQIRTMQTEISTNTEAIVENAGEIANIKKGVNNLYAGISLMPGRVYNGVYSDAITTMHCTDYLPITPGSIYAIYGGFFDEHYASYYDSNKIYKGVLPLDGLNNTYPYSTSNNFLLFTAPSDAAYTRINFFNSALIDSTDIRPEWYFRDVTNLAWAKKKVLVIGDSISTDVYGNYKKWVTDLQDECFILNGLVNNNSQHATGFVATYTGDSTTTFINRLTAVGDLTGLDAVITFGGINDWIQSIDFDAFKTAVDTYFAYLIEHATQARIIVFSPLHTALYGTTNSAGKTQKDYDDYIKSVAKDYAFPCLNLTDESGFCPDKSATFSDMWTLLPAGFSDHDGVHPIAEWEKNFLAPMIKGFLSNL